MELFFIIIGYIGTIFLTSSYIPQVYKVYKHKDTSKLSSKFLILQLITTLLWTTYGTGFLLAGDYSGLPLVIANSFIFICLMLIFYARYKFATPE
jgi:MtN3 and saliva related transmembrane protein